MLATTENGSMKKVVYTKTKNKQFDAPHLPQEVLRHLPVVDNPHRPSGLFINRPALETLKSASTDRCFFLMIDVIFLKTMSTRISSLIGGPWLYMLLQPVAAHIVLILATTEDGSLKKVVYTKTKNRQFDAREVLECLLAVVNELRGLGIEDHLLAIVADEGTNNALLVEAGYPVLVDLHHLFKRMDTNMGYVDVVLQAVHKHAVFRQNNGAEKFATIRAMTDSIPAAARRRILFEIKEGVQQRSVESMGRKLSTETAVAIADALMAEPKLKARLLEIHQLLRRVVCLLSMLKKLDLDLSK
nr:uncharacterized protein LOC121501905 [Drosophila kikkawai]